MQETSSSGPVINALLLSIERDQCGRASNPERKCVDLCVLPKVAAYVWVMLNW